MPCKVLSLLLLAYISSLMYYALSQLIGQPTKVWAGGIGYQALTPWDRFFETYDALVLWSFFSHKLQVGSWGTEGSCKVSENEEANNKSCYTLVNQAFAIAVRKVLEGYISGMDTLCTSAELRRSSNIVGFVNPL